MSSKTLQEEARQMHTRGASREEMLAHLRAGGASILESMRIFKNVSGLTLAEVKQVVHFSETWSDMRDEHDRFHDGLEEVAKTISEKK